MKVNLKHVHAVKKKQANGKYRTYYYHRYTRKRLPDDPNSIEFMAALEDQSRNGRAKEGTLGQLIEEYKASPEFKHRANSTRTSYRIQMDKLVALSDLPIAGLTRAHCKKIQAKYSDTPATANMIVAVINILMKFAIDMEYRKDNPAAGIKSYKTGEYRPWSMDEYQSFTVSASDVLSLSVTIGLYTGQRLSDCLKMKWSDLNNGYIFVKQMKTGKELEIPCHPILEAVLNKFKDEDRTGFIVNRGEGKKFSRSHFTNLFVAHREKVKLPKDLHFHGLRKSAAVALADVGCTERQIMAITGHSSFEMVSHYVKKSNQKRQAKQAIDKLTAG
ncbi:tyrosine-type recombinase/integrase [Kiloniella majae]|uniref:tyrosine-type recombinase/integrase n=1 Tax=Kiloniella majae TaxID=1938558 RepID=UPI000A2774AC|nr:tyrosine-type recombinase/integrase [Kiloniella majae]